MNYPNLEPNHHTIVDHAGVHVVCPFEQTEAGLVLHDHPVTVTCMWSRQADAGEVNCLVCEVLDGALHFAGPPEHGPEDE